MPKNAKTRRAHVLDATINAGLSVIALETALTEVQAALPGISHPVLADLEAALAQGRKIIARCNELARRIPS